MILVGWGVVSHPGEVEYAYRTHFSSRNEAAAGVFFFEIGFQDSLKLREGGGT